MRTLTTLLPKPGRICLLSWIALAIATTYQTVQTQRARSALSQHLAQTAQHLAQTEQAIARHQAAYRAIEQAMHQQVQRLTHDHHQKQNALAQRAAAAGDAAERLRRTIDQLNADAADRAAANPELAACTGQASTARDLLGHCAQRYRSVAQSADQLSLQVTGLQDFLAATCQRSD